MQVVQELYEVDVCTYLFLAELAWDPERGGLTQDGGVVYAVNPVVTQVGVGHVGHRSYLDERGLNAYVGKEREEHYGEDVPLLGIGKFVMEMVGQATLHVGD